MAYYEIYGKWYHLSYSEYFEHVVRARTAIAALTKFALDTADIEPDEEIDWGYKPTQLRVGQLDPEPTFWVGGDQMYKVRSIAEVKRQRIECPACLGKGRTWGFVPVDAGQGV